mmetsp:Transcript_17584/g.48600  ORF Transcript_17584/g.48600 Transcript_17584/m.48600 type:complete len:219 (+) Transcript_17584:513-1169(+)
MAGSRFLFFSRKIPPAVPIINQISNDSFDSVVSSRYHVVPLHHHHHHHHHHARVPAIVRRSRLSRSRSLPLTMTMSTTTITQPSQPQHQHPQHPQCRKIPRKKRSRMPVADAQPSTKRSSAARRTVGEANPPGRRRSLQTNPRVSLRTRISPGPCPLLPTPLRAPLSVTGEKTTITTTITMPTRFVPSNTTNRSWSIRRPRRGRSSPAVPSPTTSTGN